MKIKIFDRTLCREDHSFSFKEKIEIARQLEKLNVNTVEIPEIDNIKSDTLLIRTIASFVKDAVLSVAVGQTKQGVDNAASALNTAAKPRLRIELPVSTVGMEYTCHKKAPKMLELINELVSYAKEKCNDVEFCAIDATRTESDFLKEVIETASLAGASVVTLCDTAAEMLPDTFGEFVGGFKKDGVQIGVMCNNKNGLAVADAVIAIKNGIDEDVAGKIFDQMEKFASYGFNKSHAAAYSLVSYHTAYLKAHYPVEFMCAVMSLDITNVDKLLLYNSFVSLATRLKWPDDYFTFVHGLAYQQYNVKNYEQGKSCDFFSPVRLGQVNLGAFSHGPRLFVRFLGIGNQPSAPRRGETRR